MKDEIIWLGGTLLLSILALILGEAMGDIAGICFSLIALIWFFGFVFYNDKKDKN